MCVFVCVCLSTSTYYVVRVLEYVVKTFLVCFVSIEWAVDSGCATQCACAIMTQYTFVVWLQTTKQTLNVIYQMDFCPYHANFVLSILWPIAKFWLNIVDIGQVHGRFRLSREKNQNMQSTRQQIEPIEITHLGQLMQHTHTLLTAFFNEIPIKVHSKWDGSMLTLDWNSIGMKSNASNELNSVIIDEWHEAPNTWSRVWKLWTLTCDWFAMLLMHRVHVSHISHGIVFHYHVYTRKWAFALNVLCATNHHELFTCTSGTHTSYTST